MMNNTEKRAAVLAQRKAADYYAAARYYLDQINNSKPAEATGWYEICKYRSRNRAVTASRHAYAARTYMGITDEDQFFS